MVTQKEIIAALLGDETDGPMSRQAIAEWIEAEGIAPKMPCGEEKYPLNAYIWKRESTQEWVLEINGSFNNSYFIARHTEPLTTKPEDVAGLPSLYKKVESLAPPDGMVLVPWQTLDDACELLELHGEHEHPDYKALKGVGNEQ